MVAGSLSRPSPLAGNRRITNGPDMTPWCSPAVNGTTFSVTLGSAAAAARLSSWAAMTWLPPTGRRRQAADQCLPGDPDVDAAVDLLLRHSGVVGLDDGAGVLLGLQEAWDELGLVGGELGGCFFQADVDVESLGDHVAVGVPPALGLGFLSQAHQGAGEVGRGSVDAAHQLDVVAAQRG